MKIFRISKKSIYIFYKVKFTGCISYYVKLSYFFFCKNSCIQSKKFPYVIKVKFLKDKQETQNFDMKKLRITKSTKF